jgi:hypothetical protein
VSQVFRKYYTGELQIVIITETHVNCGGLYEIISHRITAKTHEDAIVKRSFDLDMYANPNCFKDKKGEKGEKGTKGKKVQKVKKVKRFMVAVISNRRLKAQISKEIMLLNFQMIAFMQNTQKLYDYCSRKGPYHSQPVNMATLSWMMTSTEISILLYLQGRIA